MNIIVILNILSFYVPIAWLAVILFFWFKNHELNYGLIKYGILAVIAIFILQGAYLTIATYNVWKEDPLSRYLLPPTSPISYFLGYAYFHFWRASVVSFFMGMIWAGFLYFANEYSGGKALGKSDIALGFFTAMAVGWPKIFAYFAVASGLLVLKGIINVVMLKDENKIATASSFVLSALAVMGLGSVIMRLPFFDNFRL